MRCWCTQLPACRLLRFTSRAQPRTPATPPPCVCRYDEAPHPSSYEAVEDPPAIWQYDYGAHRPPRLLYWAHLASVDCSSGVRLEAGCRLPCCTACTAGTFLRSPHRLFPAPCTPSPLHPAEWGIGPAKYVNRYRHAWPAALTNIQLAIDDAKRRRHRGGLWVPTGTCGQLSVAELPAPLTAPKSSWQPLTVRGRVGRWRGGASPCCGG